MPHGMSQWACATVGGATRSSAPSRCSTSHGAVGTVDMKGNTPVSYERGRERPKLSQSTPMVRWLLPLRRFNVADTSMQPSLNPGDGLLVSTWSRPQVGDLAIVAHPLSRRTVLVKRVAQRTPTGVLVRGDNPNVSTDSREFGEVPTALVIGKVL